MRSRLLTLLVGVPFVGCTCCPAPAPPRAPEAAVSPAPDPLLAPEAPPAASLAPRAERPADRVADDTCPKWLGYWKDDDAQTWYARVKNTLDRSATISLCVKKKDGTRVHYARWTAADTTVDIPIGRLSEEPEVESSCCDCGDPCR